MVATLKRSTLVEVDRSRPICGEDVWSTDLLPTGDRATQERKSLSQCTGLALAYLERIDADFMNEFKCLAWIWHHCLGLPESTFCQQQRCQVTHTSTRQIYPPRCTSPLYCTPNQPHWCRPSKTLSAGGRSTTGGNAECSFIPRRPTVENPTGIIVCNETPSCYEVLLYMYGELRLRHNRSRLRAKGTRRNGRQRQLNAVKGSGKDAGSNTVVNKEIQLGFVCIYFLIYKRFNYLPGSPPWTTMSACRMHYARDHTSRIRS